jgi:hypothetical protein
LELEEVIRMFRESLISAFKDWLEKNHEAIGDKWYDSLMKKVTEADADTAIKIMGTSLWMFNMIAGFGVMAGVGPNNVNLQGLDPALDEKSTKRLLVLISECMCLQYLPPDIATKQIPVITAKKFSLVLFTELPHE